MKAVLLLLTAILIAWWGVSLASSLAPPAPVSHITGTTQQPACQQLAREYGDDQFCTVYP